MKRKAKRKIITQRLILAIIDVLRERGELHRAQPYWNAYHCQSNLKQSKGRSFGDYCKTRYCLVCCAIRKAEIIHKYLPIIEKWEDPHFVTLTQKAVKERKLGLWFKAVKVAFDRMREKHRKRHQRDTGPPFMGIKSLECNFNPVAKTYNPHLHLIVVNREVADIIVSEWVNTWNNKAFMASRKAQNIQRITNREKALVEVIKYSSKIFTDPEMKKGKKRTLPPVIYAAAMDNIFCAMKPYNIFGRFGFDTTDVAPFANKMRRKLTKYEELDYDHKTFDWLNNNTGEAMAGYTPSPQLQYLLDNSIDKEKC